MAEDEPRRHSRRALLLVGVLAALAIAGLGLFSYIKAVERRRWDEMRAECEAIAHTLDARDPVRPVLRGAPEPGNAWDDYAWAQSTTTNKGGHHAGDYLSDRPGANRENAEADAALFAPAIQVL